MTQGYYGSISKTRFWHEHQMQCLLVTQKRVTIPTLPAQIQKCHVPHLKGLPPECHDPLFLPHKVVYQPLTKKSS